jgi:hypothetical protein
MGHQPADRGMHMKPLLRMPDPAGEVMVHQENSPGKFLDRIPKEMHSAGWRKEKRDGSFFQENWLTLFWGDNLFSLCMFARHGNPAGMKNPPCRCTVNP